MFLGKITLFTTKKFMSQEKNKNFYFIDAVAFRFGLNKFA